MQGKILTSTLAPQGRGRCPLLFKGRARMRSYTGTTMSSQRISILILVILTGLGAIGVLISGLTRSTQSPHPPTAPAATAAQPGATSPATGTPADRAIRIAEAQIARDPQKAEG